MFGQKSRSFGTWATFELGFVYRFLLLSSTERVFLLTRPRVCVCAAGEIPDDPRPLNKGTCARQVSPAVPSVLPQHFCGEEKSCAGSCIFMSAKVFRRSAANTDDRPARLRRSMGNDQWYMICIKILNTAGF